MSELRSITEALVRIAVALERIAVVLESKLDGGTISREVLRYAFRQAAGGSSLSSTKGENRP